ncbi:putative nuclease HARBI1 [Prorops nasuta]|uniref:putative nuclease HARBI1 n=1 Tax=Prorops nasuta TaxID=863751 RepID=UPI0034CED3D1
MDDLLQIWDIIFESDDEEVQDEILYLLQKQDRQSVVDRFGVAKSTLWECVYNVVFVLHNHVQEFIKWPQERRLLQIQNKFLAIDNFLGIVGVIDGSHIPISAPTEYPNSYINRKGFHSILLQGICDSEMKFIDICIGYCGSYHDARMWNNSYIKQAIDENIFRFFPENTHLIGDSAYLLSTYLLIPKLNSVYMKNTDMITALILACCILHNMCIDNEDGDSFDTSINEYEENIHNADVLYESDVFLEGSSKRDLIANLLNE